jgi:hypothetical protein
MRSVLSSAAAGQRLVKLTMPTVDPRVPTR